MCDNLIPPITYHKFPSSSSGQTSCAANNAVPITTQAECEAAAVQLNLDTNGIYAANYGPDHGHCRQWGNDVEFNTGATQDICGHAWYNGHSSRGPCICKRGGTECNQGSSDFGKHSNWGTDLAAHAARRTSLVP